MSCPTTKATVFIEDNNHDFSYPIIDPMENRRVWHGNGYLGNNYKNK